MEMLNILKLRNDKVNTRKDFKKLELNGGVNIKTTEEAA
jgi:hypothetical protein